MGVNSYAEIFTTLIGWHMYNVIWDVLSTAGLVYLPFLGILLEHWQQGFLDGEEGGGAPAAIRALEVDIYIGLTVIVLAGVPSSLTSLNRSDVFYAPPATVAEPSPTTATGAAPLSTYGAALGGTPSVVNVPVWWYSVMAISAGVDSAIIAGSGLSLDHLRSVTEAAKQAKLDDLQIRFEALRFYNECFLPARTRYLASPASSAATAALATFGTDDTEWIGSHAFLDDPALYPNMYADREVPSWPFDPARDRDQAGAPILPTWGRPSCKEWWEGGAVPGLKAKVLTAVGATSKLQSLVRTFAPSLSSTRQDDIVVQAALDKTRLTVIPDAYVPATSNLAKDTFSSTTVMIAGFVTTFFTWLATAVLKPSLPFVQCLLLMGIYMLLPFVLVISRYSLTAMVQGALAIFTVKFWTVLWFLADFLDDKLALAIYPDADSAMSAMSSFFKKGDPTKAMLLNLVVMALYLALPALWSGLIAMAGVRVGSALNTPFNAASSNANAAGSTAAGLGAKAAATFSRGVSKVARAIQAKLK